jgi:hypothetical protein
MTEEDQNIHRFDVGYGQLIAEADYRRKCKRIRLCVTVAAFAGLVVWAVWPMVEFFYDILR